jgi:hypothetical protein
LCIRFLFEHLQCFQNLQIIDSKIIKKSLMQIKLKVGVRCIDKELVFE